MTSSQAEKPGLLISLVEAVDGKLKIHLVAYRAEAADARLADRVCALVRQSGVQRAQGALVVEKGDLAFRSS